MGGLFSVGTRTLVVGYHQVFIHPLFVAAAWIKLYGWPRHWLIWVCFIMHDWGYWGCTDIDGVSGSKHPELGGRIIRLLGGSEWQQFCLCHSRDYARSYGVTVSKLAVADKMAMLLMPYWMHVVLVILSGEFWEYTGKRPGHDYTWNRWHVWQGVYSRYMWKAKKFIVQHVDTAWEVM